MADGDGGYVEEPKRGPVVDWEALLPKILDMLGIVAFIAVVLGVGFLIGDYIVSLLVGILYVLLARL